MTLVTLAGLGLALLGLGVIALLMLAHVVTDLYGLIVAPRPQSTR